MDSCCGGESLDPSISDAVDDVHDKVDSYTSSLLSSLVAKIKEQQSQPLHPDDIQFPAPYAADDANGDDTVDVNCFSQTIVKESMEDQTNYEIPRVDDYLGDIGFFDDVCFYGKFSNGMFGGSFDENQDPPNKDEWTDLSQRNTEALAGARNYFTGVIGNPVYKIRHVKSLQQEKKKEDGNAILKTKQLNDWEMVTVENLKNQNQVLSQLLGDGPKGDDSDLWITLIAFCGYGSHRTTPKLKDGRHEDAYFMNDVSFLDQYEVRAGYKKYGAVAYFDAKHKLTEIKVSHLDKTIPAPKKKESASAEWKHAKWCWKVSLSVATFLVDHVAHNQLRESSGLIKALRKLPEDHELRRLMLPFTYGTAHRTRAMNEYLREFGLFHRAFGFTYNGLQKLIRDSMMDAPKLEKGKNARRKREDAMKYRFRLFKKKVHVMRKLPDEMYPIYTDSWDFWVQTLDFVKKYMQPYYGEGEKDDSKLVSTSEPEIQEFYNALLGNLKIDPIFRLKKFNVINILAHFICGATVWNHHLHSAVSFEYSVDPDFTGLKILGNNATQNNIQNYVEYCCVAMCKGWGESDLMRIDVWKKILEGQKKPHQAKTNEATLNSFFKLKMGVLEKTIHTRTNTRAAPYSSLSPQYLQSSARL